MACLIKHINNKILSKYSNTCKLCSAYSKCTREIVEYSDERKLLLKIPHMASGSNGMAEASIGDTTVFTSAVIKEKLTPDLFLPLTVDFQQKYIATGFIPADQRRYAYKLSKEVLTSRLIDRSIRPLFERSRAGEISMTCKLRSCDGLHDPDVIGINAASACLATSDIPWNGPIAAVRVGHVNGKLVIFPTRKELQDSDLNLVVVAGRQKKIFMLDGSGLQIKKEILKRAITTAVKECQPIINAISNLAALVGKTKLQTANIDVPAHVMEGLRELTKVKILNIFLKQTLDKPSQTKELHKVLVEAMAEMKNTFIYKNDFIYKKAFNMIVSEVFKNLILTDDLRVDGRKMDEVRSTYCDINIYGSLHGSSRFERGETIVDCSVALDSLSTNNNIDPLSGLVENFSVNYELPNFAIGETGYRVGKKSRREIGHGTLIKKALLPLIPEVPYVISLSAEIFASNGSSSMSSVCGGSMALMDAGINLIAPVSGISVGLVAKTDDKGDISEHKLLTDITALEDSFGDMDLKLACTEQGITALQTDVKNAGLPFPIVSAALDKAIVANKKILKIMKKVIAVPKTNKAQLPVTTSINMSPAQKLHMQEFGGRNLKNIQARIGAVLSWESETKLSIYAPTEKAMQEVLVGLGEMKATKRNGQDLINGQVYSGVIKEILDYGVMVELLPGMNPTIVSNSHLHVDKINHASELNLRVGDTLKLQYFGRDPVSGLFRLSRKLLMADPSQKATAGKI